MMIFKNNIFLIFLCAWAHAILPSVVLTPLLQQLLDDFKLYKLDSQGDAYVHAGDLYEHSIWTYNAMVELLRSNSPYAQDLQLTEREQEIIALAALLHDI